MKVPWPQSPLLGRRGAAANFLEADILRDVRGYISPNPATVQSDVLQLPNGIGRSRHEQRVYAIHNTASMNSRLFRPLRPGSLGLSRQWGSISAYWESVSTERSIQGLNHKPSLM